LLLSITLFIISCDKEETEDSIPEDRIDFPALIDDWEWQHTINRNTNDTLMPFGTENIIYTYTSNDLFYPTEDGRRGQTYVYYVTSETRVFDGDTCNKMYLYISGNKVFENFFYLPVNDVLVIYDGIDYIAKGTYHRMN
jgi:hypothetical protein